MRGDRKSEQDLPPGSEQQEQRPESALGSTDFSTWSREDLIARLRHLEADLAAESSPEDYRRMLYELQVHQIELEMQNREMRELRSQLEDSRDLYVDLYDSAPVAYLTLNREGLIRSINLTGAELLRWERESLSEKPFSGFLRPDHVPGFFSYLRELLREGHARPIEVCLGPPGGAPRTVKVEGAQAVSPRDGETVARLILTDVTEVKETEALQRRVNRALRALSRVQDAARAAQSCRCLMDQVCRFLNEDAGYALAWVGEPVTDGTGSVRILGASGATGYLDRVIGEIRWTPDDQGGRGPFGRAVQTREPVISNSVGTDPSFAPWRERALTHNLNAVAGIPLVEGDRALGVLGLYAEDAESFDDEEMQWLTRVADEVATAWISLRHREERCKAEEERNRLVEILEATPDFVAIATADERVVYWNAGAYEVLGYDPENYRPEEHVVRDHFPRWAYECLTTEVLPLVRERGVWRGETAFLSRDGREVPVNQVILAHYGPEGELEYYSTIAHDLSTFKRQRAELERSRRLMALGELGSVLAHQLNQPLTAALTFAEGTLQRFDRLEEVPAGLREGLEQIRVQVEKAGGIVRDLRNFLRGGSPHFQRVDLNALVQTVGPRLEMGRETLVPCLEQHLADDLPYVSADPTLVQECLQNLVNNATEAMEDQAAPVVHITTESRADGLVEVRVRDSGGGLPEPMQENLDRPLYTTKPGGLGLGVAICRSVIEAHDGNLWATPNEPEPGTTFHFTLKAADRDA
ncbi:GAF domain-containing protein [Thiohalorhabdus methylotrophus]|uniref:histidine kinase n=1 Tax=Thiohalorhabdus methylotrophus TaxID=3242694 RepID=A0ABV4TVB4_9GAMM